MSLRPMGWVLTPRTLCAGPSGLSVPWKASRLFVPGFPPPTPLRPSSVASLEEPSLVQLETRGASRAGCCGHQDGGVWCALTPEPSPAAGPFSGWLVVTLVVSEPQQVLMRETERLRSCTCLRLDFRTRGHTHPYRKEPGNT